MSKPKRRLDRLFAPRLFRALGDPNRIALLCCLARAGEPRSVTDASSCCDIDLSVVSRHLAVLREAGAVEARRRGKQVCYTVRARELASSLRAIADALEGCCCGKGAKR